MISSILPPELPGVTLYVKDKEKTSFPLRLLCLCLLVFPHLLSQAQSQFGIDPDGGQPPFTPPRLSEAATSVPAHPSATKRNTGRKERKDYSDSL